MPNYFSKYPKIEYTFADGTIQQLTDINVRLQLSSEVSAKTDAFYPYGWREQDRPDTIADKYYNSEDLYWLVLQSNNIYDAYHELPMGESVFIKYLRNKYKDMVEEDNLENILDYVTSTIHHYEDKDGFIIDEETFLTVGNTRSVTIFDYEFDLNEKKRQVRLLDSKISRAVVEELEDKLRKIKSEIE